MCCKYYCATKLTTNDLRFDFYCDFQQKSVIFFEIVVEFANMQNQYTFQQNLHVFLQSTLMYLPVIECALAPQAPFSAKTSQLMCLGRTGLSRHSDAVSFLLSRCACVVVAKNVRRLVVVVDNVVVFGVVVVVFSQVFVDLSVLPFSEDCVRLCFQLKN